jgi:hypothetical protein
MGKSLQSMISVQWLQLNLFLKQIKEKKKEF